MFNLRYKQLLFIIPIVLVAGCTGRSGVLVDNGVAVLDFSPDFNQVGGGTPVTFSLLLENIGEATARNVRAEFVGLDDWQMNTSRLQPSPPATLSSADPTHNNLKGDQELLEWVGTAPAKQVEQNYDFAAKLYYSYQTKSSVLVKAIGFDYLKSLPKEQQASVTQEVVRTSTSKGPLDVGIKIQQTFLTQSTGLPIEIEITNTGFGRTYTGNAPSKATLDYVSVEVDGVTRCTKQTSNGASFVKLINGEVGRLICYLDTSGATTLQSFPVDVTIDYGYFVEKTSSISVLKTIGTPSATFPPTGGTGPGTQPGTTSQLASCAERIAKSGDYCKNGQGGCTSTSECDQSAFATPSSQTTKLECREVGAEVKVCCWSHLSNTDCKSDYENWKKSQQSP